MGEIKKYKLEEKEVLSFELDNETLSQFEDLIYDLEEKGVYMDFTWVEDYKFTSDKTTMLHIVKNDNLKPKWDYLSKECSNYYKSSIVTVDLSSTPDIYFIFAPIILNKMTNIVFDFYEGEGSVFISFFKNFYIDSMRKSYFEVDENCEDYAEEFDLEEDDLYLEIEDID